MSLLNLKSIFSPTNTKFQDNQSDLSTFPRQFDNNFQQSNLLELNTLYDDGVGLPIQSSVLALNSIFDNGLNTPIQSNLLNFPTPEKDKIFVPNSNLKRNGEEYLSQFNFDSVFDDTLSEPQRSNLLELESIYKNEFTARSDVFITKRVDGVNDTNFFNTPPRPTQFNATNPTDFSTAVGNNESPFTPLSQLGQSALDGLSWESLYNSDHSPLDNPSHKGLTPINYPNSSRDNLKIGTEGLGFVGSFTNVFDLSNNIFGGDRGKEPYKISPIGNEGRDMNSGGRFLPLTRALEDTDRILEFLKSPAGVGFILKQNTNVVIRNTVVRKTGGGLTRVPQRFNTTFNPLQTLLATGARVIGQGVPNVLFTTGGFDFDLGILEPQEYGIDAIPDFKYRGPKQEINDTFTKAEPSENNGGFLSNLANNLGITGDVSTYSSGDKATLQPIIRGGGISGGSSDKAKIFSDTIDLKTATPAELEAASGQNLDFNPEATQEGMPFYFKDLRDNAYIFFRAYIEGLTENIAPSYSVHNYMGRSEPVYTYERAEREITLTLKLIAQTKKELDKIYEKMERLTKMCYPEYIGDVYGQNRMKPPLTRFRYGELYGSVNDELLGYIKSISYSIDQSSTYETQAGKRVPRHILATIGYQVIHNEAPSLNMKQKIYGINK